MADSESILPTTPARPAAPRRRESDQRRQREPPPRKRRDTGLTDDQGTGRDDEPPLIDDFA